VSRVEQPASYPGSEILSASILIPIPIPIPFAFFIFLEVKHVILACQP